MVLPEPVAPVTRNARRFRIGHTRAERLAFFEERQGRSEPAGFAQGDEGPGFSEWRQDRVQPGAVWQPAVHPAAGVVESPSGHRSEPLCEAANFGFVGENRRLELQPRACVDPHGFSSVDQHVGDVIAVEQWLQHACVERVQLQPLHHGEHRVCADQFPLAANGGRDCFWILADPVVADRVSQSVGRFGRTAGFRAGLHTRPSVSSTVCATLRPTPLAGPSPCSTSMKVRWFRGHCVRIGTPNFAAS